MSDAPTAAVHLVVGWQPQISLQDTFQTRRAAERSQTSQHALLGAQNDNNAAEVMFLKARVANLVQENRMLLLKLHIANKHLLEGQRYERHFNAQHDRGQLLPPQQRPNAPTGHQQLPLGLTTPGVNPLEAHDCNTAQLWRMFEDDINEEHQQMEEFVPKQHPPTSEHGWHMPGMDTYRQASTSSNGLVSDHVDDDLVALL